MTNDIIIVVPKGTRVRYAENEHVDKVYVIDAAHLDIPVVFDPISMLKGFPLYEPEHYAPGPWPGIPEDLYERADQARRKANENFDRDTT